jgi:hypothetical protein
MCRTKYSHFRKLQAWTVNPEQRLPPRYIDPIRWVKTSSVNSRPTHNLTFHANTVHHTSTLVNTIKEIVKL